MEADNPVSIDIRLDPHSGVVDVVIVGERNKGISG